jgi:hypothetical protein
MYVIFVGELKELHSRSKLRGFGGITWDINLRVWLGGSNIDQDQISATGNKDGQKGVTKSYVQ